MIKRRKKLIFGLSEKADGSMNIYPVRKKAFDEVGGKEFCRSRWFKATDKRHLSNGVYSANCQAPANRKKFFSRLVINFGKIIWAKGVHGDKIALVNKKPAGRVIKGVDGLISRDKNIFLALTVADCLPLYFYDSEKNIIGLAHAGWRGVLKNIAGKMAVKLISLSDAENLKVYIGPHLKQCHFEVKGAVLKNFFKYGDYVKRETSGNFVDLAGIVKKQLLQAGVKEKNIKINLDCTCCRKKYFSFRRDKPEEPELMAAFIGRKS